MRSSNSFPHITHKLGLAVLLAGALLGTLMVMLVYAQETAVTNTIANNDFDEENPYTFITSGTGYCSSPIYVDQDATGNNDGFTWADAFTDLQDGLSLARNCSSVEVWVATGTYSPGTDRTDTFTITAGIQLYGGFVATETVRTERNWETNRTILNGDVDDNDIKENGVVTNTDNIVGDENNYHVLYAQGVTSTNKTITESTIIDGFIVTAARANNGTAPHSRGGGLYCDGTGSGNDCSPTINNVTFSGNWAFDGGAIYNNSTDGGSSSPVISNVTFFGNTAYYGGSLFNYSDNGGTSSPVLTDVTFLQGRARESGGVFYNSSNASTSSPTINNAIFSGNKATNDAGGVMYNISKSSGSSSPVINNATFSNNTAGFEGGVFYNISKSSGASNPVLDNVILWGNSATSSGNQIYNSSATPLINYSLIESGDSGSNSGTAFSDGTGNINADPLFVDADGADSISGTLDDDLRLDVGSPAIDAGDNSTCESTDIRGENRDDWTCDMGAYEVQFSDSDTVSKTIAGVGTYTFGPTLAKVVVGDDGDCLTGLSIQRQNSDHLQATEANLQTGVNWTLSPVECSSGFTVTLTLPTPNFTPDADSKLCRWDTTGSSWDCGESSDHIVGSSTMADDSVIDVVSRQNVNAFSQWTAGNSVGPTAVSHSSFSANPQPTPMAVLLVLMMGIGTAVFWLKLWRKSGS